MRIVVAVFNCASLTIHMFKMHMSICIENGTAILVKREFLENRSERKRNASSNRDAFYLKESLNKGILITSSYDIYDIYLKYDVPPSEGEMALVLGDSITLEIKLLLTLVLK